MIRTLIFLVILGCSLIPKSASASVWVAPRMPSHAHPTTVQNLKPIMLASRECVYYTSNQAHFAYQPSLFSLPQQRYIWNFVHENSLKQEAFLLDLRQFNGARCEFATILPQNKLRWPTPLEQNFGYNLKPENWFYTSNPRERYYLFERGYLTPELGIPVNIVP
jgi:hypothetical protein